MLPVIHCQFIEIECAACHEHNGGAKAAGVYVLNKQDRFIVDSIYEYQDEEEHVAEGEDGQCNKCVEDQAVGEEAVHLEEQQSSQSNDTGNGGHSCCKAAGDDGHMDQTRIGTVVHHIDKLSQLKAKPDNFN